jgi:hypothetical protein
MVEEWVLIVICVTPKKYFLCHMLDRGLTAPLASTTVTRVNSFTFTTYLES